MIFVLRAAAALSAHDAGQPPKPWRRSKLPRVRRLGCGQPALGRTRCMRSAHSCAGALQRRVFAAAAATAAASETAQTPAASRHTTALSACVRHCSARRRAACGARAAPQRNPDSATCTASRHRLRPPAARRQLRCAPLPAALRLPPTACSPAPHAASGCAAQDSTACAQLGSHALGLHIVAGHTGRLWLIHVRRRNSRISPAAHPQAMRCAVNSRAVSCSDAPAAALLAAARTSRVQPRPWRGAPREASSLPSSLHRLPLSRNPGFQVFWPIGTTLNAKICHAPAPLARGVPGLAAVHPVPWQPEPETFSE